MNCDSLSAAGRDRLKRVCFVYNRTRASQEETFLLIEILITIANFFFTCRLVQLVSQSVTCTEVLSGATYRAVVVFLDSGALSREIKLYVFFIIRNQWKNLDRTQLGFCFVFTPTSFH